MRQVDDPGAVREFGRDVPDLPQWVDVRGALLCGRSTVFTDETPGAFAVATPHVPLVSLVGQPPADVLTAAIAFTERRAGETPVLLVETAAAETLQPALAGWHRETAILHVRMKDRIARRPAAPTPPPSAGSFDLRWIEAGDPDAEAQLSTVPEGLREELIDAAGHTAIACAWVDGRPVAFGYAPWATERWFDMSIDTIDAFRRRGLARACADAIIARHGTGGREPVWGALADNAASLSLARALGFEPVAEVAIYERDDDRDTEL